MSDKVFNSIRQIIFLSFLICDAKFGLTLNAGRYKTVLEY